MKRCIFSLYIDVDKNSFEKNQDLEKNILTKNELKNNYDFLVSSQKKYARQTSADYIIFGADDQYAKYAQQFESNISVYNIINFYKIHLLYMLAETYDEVLYLDLDVVPLTNKNIFELNFEKNGIAVRVNHERNPKLYLEEMTSQEISRRSKWFDQHQGTFSVRSPTAKYWNCRAMLINSGYSGNNDVYNTGIVGAHKKHLEQLDYFGTFKDDLDLMKSLVEEDGMWPNFIQAIFGYDNETLFSYKMIRNNVPKLDLDDKWHYVMNNWSYIPSGVNFVHVINKDIEYAKSRYEKINI